MNVFELCASINLDSSKYDSALNKAENNSANFAKKLGSGLVNAGKIATTAIVGVGTAVSAMGAGLVNESGKVAEYGDNIDKMSQKMGISAEAYQEWDFILQHSGASISSLMPSMKTLVNAGQNGSDAFSKLGMNLNEVQKMSQEELFSATITRLQGMEEGSERTALAMELLGKAGMEMGALLNTSAEDTEAMRKQVHELGGVMSDEAVKASALYQDSLQNLGVAMDGIKRGLISEFLPSITTVMDGLTAIFSGDDSGIGKISEGLDNLVNKIIETIPKIAETAVPIIKNLADSIIKNLPKLFEAGTNIITELIKYIIDSLPMLIDTALKIILQIVDGIIKALPELIPACVEALTTIVETIIDNLDLLIEGAIAIIVALAEGLIDALPRIIEKIPIIITKLVEAIINNLPHIVEAGIQIIIALASGLIQAIPQILSAIPQIISSMIGAIGGFIGEFFSMGGNLLSGLVQGFIGGIGSAISAVKNAVSGVVDAVKGVFGIHSPSKVFASIADYCVMGFQQNFEPIADGTIVDDGLKNLKDEFGNTSMQFGVGFSSDIDTLQGEINGIPEGFSVDGKMSTDNRVLALLAEYLPQLGNQQIVLDTGALVGGTVNKFDQALGRLALNAGRSV